MDNLQNVAMLVLKDVESPINSVVTALKTLQSETGTDVTLLPPWFNSLDSRIRYLSLNLFFKTCPKDHLMELQQLAHRFLLDPDAYVKCCMLRALHDLDFSTLDIKLYHRLLRVLNSDEIVQVECLDLLCKLVQQFSSVTLPSTTLTHNPTFSNLENQLEKSTFQPTTFSNDVFLRLCDVINQHNPIKSRIKACEILGSIPNVDSNILAQAFSPDHLLPTGRKRKREIIIPCDITTCGALISAFEDESPELRSAAIKSSKEFVNQVPTQVLDSLVYATNDALPSIRKAAMEAIVSCVSEGATLDVDQLITCMSMLQDQEISCQEATLQLVQHIVLAGPESLAIVLANLHQHLSQDVNKTFYAVGWLGYHNAKLIATIISTFDQEGGGKGQDILSCDALYSVMLYCASKASEDVKLSKGMKRYISRHMKTFPTHFSVLFDIKCK